MTRTVLRVKNMLQQRRHDIQYNDTQHNDIQHNNKENSTLSIMTFIIMTLNAECYLLILIYAECHLCNLSFMLSIANKPIMLSVIMLNSVVLSGATTSTDSTPRHHKVRSEVNLTPIYNEGNMLKYVVEFTKLLIIF
jgi:hypothetical protein